MAFETGPQTQYTPDGQRTYNKNGELVTHHGYFETLAAQTAVFTRASVAYRQDGSQVAAGVPRYEYAQQPVPVWQDTFDTDQLAEYTSGGDVPATWAVSGGVLTGTGGLQATLIKNDLMLQNVEIEVNSDQADNGGIIARYQDNNNYYLLTIRDDSGTPSNNLTVYKRVNGVFTAIASANLTWARGTSKLIKFTLHGSRIEAYFDGQKVISIKDTTFSGGGVGLRNTEIDIARYLDFKVYHAQQAVMVEEGTTNLLTANQASVETNTTGFGAIDVTMSRVTTEKWHGNASLRVVYSGSSTAERVIVDTTGLAASQPYTFTSWIKGPIGAKVRLVLREKRADASIVGDTASADIALTGTWQRASVTRTLSSEGVRAEQQIRNVATGGPYAMTLYVDGWQLEQKAYPSSWQLPGSARTAELLTVPTNVLNVDKGTIEFDVVVNPNVHTSAANWAMAFAVSDSGEQNQIRFAKREFSADWAAKFTNPEGTSWSMSISSSFMPPGVHRIALKWNRSTTTAKVLVDGAVVASNTSAPLPSSFASASGGVAYVGRWISTAHCLNSLIGNLRISNIDREDSEIAAAYATGLPLSVDEYTTYLMSMNGTLQPTIRSFGLWSKNGRHILHDPQSGQGIEVWDDNSLKVLIGLLANGKIGIKANDGEIYSGKFQTGNENSNTYIALNSDTLSAFYNGKQKLDMWGGNWGNIVFYEDGNRVGQLYTINESDPVLGGTKRRFVVWSTGDGSLRLDGPGIELDSDHVNLARSSSSQIYVRGKIIDSLVPYTHNTGYVGQSDRRWNSGYFNILRATNLSQGDTCFEETTCPLCEKAFVPSDTIVLLVRHIDEDFLGTMCIPVHSGCQGIHKALTLEIQETEELYRFKEDGTVETYRMPKFAEVEEQIHQIKQGYELDKKTGQFKKKAVAARVELTGIQEAVEASPERVVTKEEAVEVVKVIRNKPIMKKITVELNT